LTAKRNSLERQVLNFIREYGLVSGGEVVLVAVSGGPDSLCLLQTMVNLKAELDLELHIVHLDHGLRGEESEQDAVFVAELAGKLGIPATVEKRDVKAWNEEKRTSLEEAAREVRYRFFADTARKTGATRVAVGHNRDDQVETALLHYLRGTGISGLRGLRAAAPIPYDEAKDGVFVIRPLLNISRKRIEEYCQEHGLQPRIDSSNAQTRFLRNRIRRELIPLLKQYNPEVDEALLRLADMAGDDADFIDGQATAVFSQTATREGCLTCLDAGKLSGLPLALQRRVFRLALQQIYGNLRDIEAVHIESLVKLLFGSTGKSVQLPDGLTATNERGRMVLCESGGSVCPWPVINDSFNLKIPGETQIPGWRVIAEVINENYYRQDDIFGASFDLAKTGRVLTVRGRQPGDRFHPLGLTHSRKLQDFMVDAAVPRTWRNSVPIVCSQGQIAWVVGWRMDDRVKITGNTQQVLRVEFHRVGQGQA
jgi:tRNA(Ile)-lysidine synthase